MKAKYYISFLLSLMLGIGTLAAQSGNRLYIPELTSLPGKTISLPVYVDNTAEIVAVQFTLKVPEGSWLDYNSAALTNRATDHTVTVREMGNQEFLCMVFSPTNASLKARTGKLLTMNLYVSNDYEENAKYDFELKDAVLSMRDGTNALTEVSASSLSLIKRPDLQVQNVVLSETKLAPSDFLNVSWQVSNVGGVATESGWMEQISLVQADGSNTFLGYAYYVDVLEAGGTVSRQVSLQLSDFPGIDGDVKVQVQIVPQNATGESEATLGDNTATTSETVVLSKLLKLELPTGTIDETYGQPIRCSLARSGNRTEDQTFTLTTTADSRLSIPQTVTIPAGQSAVNFYIQLTDNETLDDGGLIEVSAEGNGYEAVAGQFTIVDNEYPDLTLTASKSQVTEGETFQLTITATRAPKEDVEVTLSSEVQNRFNFPAMVILPAGQTSVTAEITVNDDDVPSLTFSNAFTAYATDFNKGEVVVILEDNDIPALELTLTPSQVSESVGPVAVAATLRRTGVTTNKITVKLSDDSEGGIYYGTTTIEIPKGVEEVHFNLGPIDNANVDGDRTVNITAAVYISSCSCNAQGESAGVVSAPLTILDDDGPALTLKSSNSTVKEGSKVTLTISRNTATTEALTLTLSGDKDEMFEEYDHTVIIPAGASETSIELTSKSNDVSDDSFTAVFTATCEGFSKGSCFLMVTDQTLPDLQISSFTTDVAEVEAKGVLDVTVEVSNVGFSEAPSPVFINIYLAGKSSPMATINTKEPLAVGHTAAYTTRLVMPDMTGSAELYAVVNEKHEVNELNFSNNNCEPLSLNLLPRFTAVAQTDKSIYLQGETIIISGKATGSAAANADVEVYIMNEGLREYITATTDASGNFRAEWTPYTMQMGHFSIGACYPGEELVTEQAGVDVLGLKNVSSAYISCEIEVDVPYSKTLEISNPGRLKQVIKSVELLSEPSDCEVTFTNPTHIEADGKAYINITMTGTAPTNGSDWESMTLRITTEEGATLDIPLYYYCHSQQGKLVADVDHINTTMIKGSSRDYNIIVTNTGRGNTGKVTLTLPDVEWMKCVSPKEVASLEHGESATFILRLTPGSDIPLNVATTGCLAFNCENGEGLALDYTIEAVSEAHGTLTVDVVDEYTYDTNEQPHVKGAGVVVRHPATQAVVAQGLTDENGIFSIDLPEGYYTLSVTEEHHNSYSNNVLIDPGKENAQQVFLSFNAVTYMWDVKETEVEDKYLVETVVKYETNVPKPVVIISLPKERPADNSVIPVVVTNKGLINAQNVDLTLSCSDGYTLEMLSESSIDVLAPQQAHIFYALFKKKTPNPARRRVWGNPELDCIQVLADAWYDYVCGEVKNMEEALAQNGWGECMPDLNIDDDDTDRPRTTLRPKPHTGPTTPNGRSWKPGPGVNPRTSDWVWPEILRQAFCDMPCSRELAEALACEAASKVIPDKISCPYNLANKCIYGKGWACLGGIRGCIPVIGDDCWDGYIKCWWNRAFGNNARRRAPSEAQVNNRGYVTAKNYAEGKGLLYREADIFNKIIEEYFGDPEWMKCDNVEQASILYRVGEFEEGHTYTEADFENIRPAVATDDMMKAFVERVNNTMKYQDSGYEGIENYVNPNTLAIYNEEMEQCEQEAKDAGWNSVAEMYTAAYNDLKDYVSEGQSAVCASVTLKFSQTMVMTRQAFRGTLTVTNGSETTAMKDVRLMLEVKDPEGNTATSREFQINAENLDGFSGELNLTSGWTLDAQQTGTATVLFIPTKYAAPTEKREYSFGGRISYIDPFTELEVTRELYPVTLTVKPTPELDLTYFMQRDIYGDDPLTEAVEPSEPAEFSLLINNIGYGDATNVRMVTNQPEIINNEKGLLIDFKILSAQLNGGDKTLALGGSIPTDFGTIPAHSQAYAQWWFQSSLLGHFTDYDVQATHVTSYDNPDLSLLNNVTIHELIRSIKVDDGEVTGFVVNDLTDAADTPDMLYFTDGTTAEVGVAANATVEAQSNTEYLLTINPSQPGWNYGHITDPTFGRAKLIGIQRQSDGREINLRNFWQTDRTLIDGKDWLYENNLHFVDNFASSGETYVLTFEPRPEVELEVASFDGLPEESTVLTEPLQKIIVNFNKAIDAETFTREDITLNCQGNRVEAPIAITAKSSTQFELDLSEVTAENGFYVLTVQTAGIADADGFAGTSGKSASWTQFVNATTLAFSFEKAEVTYGDNFTEPKVTTNSPAVPTYSSSNPLVASVNPETGRVTINAVGTTQVEVALEQTPTSDAISKSYVLSVLQPEGLSEAQGAAFVEITIPDDHAFATFCYLYPIDFSGATDDCRAYIADRIETNTIYCKEVEEVKGGVGLLLHGKPGVYTFPVLSSTNEPENLLVGTLAPAYVETSADGMDFLGLKDDKFVPMNTGVVKANKAYLALPDNDVRAFNIVLDGADGVSTLVSPDAKAEWYDIMGVKVAGPARRGIYIRNGKKVVVK